MEKTKKKNVLVGILFLVSIIIFMFAIWFFNSDVENVDTGIEGNIKTVATIFPIYDIMRQVGGEKIEANLLLPPGASPHTFEISPQEVKNLNSTNLLLFAGAGIDLWANTIVKENINQSRNDYVAIDLSQVVELQPFGESDNHDDEEGENEPENDDKHAPGEMDPHYWLNPDNAALIAQEIASQLTYFDPENRDYYEQNASTFISNLEERAVAWQEDIDNLSKKEIIVYHDAWFYFANYFNIDILASLEPFPGKLPSPKYLQEVNEIIEENNINVLFIEPQLSPDQARAMAQNLVADIEVLDPLGGVEGRETYIDLIDYNVNTIVNALSD